MDSLVNPFNLPNPAPGEIAPVSIESFDLMEEWEEEGDGTELAEPESDDVSKSEGSFNLNMNG